MEMFCAVFEVSGSLSPLSASSQDLWLVLCLLLSI